MWRPYLLAALVAGFPGLALAHAVERGLIQLLPTEHYLAGAGAAVALSFLVLSFWSGRRATTSLAFGPECHIDGKPRTPLQGLVQWLSVAVFAGLLAVGWFGSRDPLENLAPLVVWTAFWIGMPAIVALFGNPWSWCNPWSVPLRLLGGGMRRTLPAWLGYWPAMASFGCIIWYDLVYPAPRDPAHLAWAMLGYWAVHLMAMLIWGEPWLRHGEAFSVFLGLIGRLSPFPRSARPAGLPLSGWLFVTAAIGAITADGLGGTFWWLGTIGINPLSPPGRTALVWANSFGLLGVWLSLSLAYAFAVWAGWRLAGKPRRLGKALGWLALSLLPIALAYHLAHFLTHFLINGQYLLVALSDPFHTGADWLGLGDYFVSTAFLNNLQDVETIWHVQVAIILGGHLWGVVAAHRACTQLYGASAAKGGLPLALLMVAMTVLGLWLLSTPTGG